MTIRLLLLALLIAVSATVPAADAADPVTIEYWHINSPTFGGPAVKELVQVCLAVHVQSQLRPVHGADRRDPLPRQLAEVRL